MVKYLIIFFLLAFTLQPKYLMAEEYIFKPDSVDSNPVSSSKYNKVIFDNWLGVDKAAHIAGSCMLTIAASESLRHLAGYSSSTSMRFGVGVAFSLGLGKECHDFQQSNNRFSYKDILADIVGITVGVLLVSVE